MNTIAVDYTPAVRQQAGIGRIVHGQIRALAEARPDLDLRLLIVGRLDPNERHTLATSAPRPFHATPLGERNMVRLWHRLDIPWPTVEMVTGGPLDIFHATDFALAPSRARRKVLTIHDLAFIFYPDASLPSLYHYLNVVVPRSVRRADHLIADSHHTAHDLQEQWRVSPDRVSVVQGAVDHSQFAPITDKTRLSDLRLRYGIHDRPFIFALSSLQPRKNFVRLIEAYHMARLSADLDHLLVIAGGKGWLYEDIFAKVRSLGLEDQVVFTGFVPEDELAVFYSAADVFAYPSLYEGFGLPVIEALACGTPVLAADNSCLPEAGGPGALYVKANDINDIAQGLVRMCQDATLRDTLATAGLAHAARFTWQRSAEQLWAAYQIALSQ